MPPSIATIDHAVAGGAILALGSVVLLQYAHHLWRTAQLNANHSRVESERDAVEDELDSAKRDHKLTRLENQVLREFVSQTRPEQAIDLLLRRFVPKPEHGFAALIERTPGGTLCEFSRGLSDESLASLKLSESELAVVHEARLVTLTGREVGDSSVTAGLTTFDAAKAGRLHLVALGTSADPVGVFATTDLYPEGAPLAQQAELAKRLTTNLASGLKLARALRDREAQLRLTSEMLELRGVADRRFSSPLGLIQAFVAALRTKVAAEGAAIFLNARDDPAAGAAVYRCGGPAAVGPSGRWRRSEESLGRLATSISGPRTISAEELPRYGVDPVIRSVLLLPLRRDGLPLGTICLSRGEPAEFTAGEQALASWAAEFLAHAIPRVLNQAVIERQARQDGLTGLANRREFDGQITAVVENAQATGSEVSLILCDLDRFKSINDRFGHRAGDEVLRAAARLLQEEVQKIRSSDWALTARYGGEEMAVLLPGFAPTGALRVAEAIRRAIEQLDITFEAQRLHVTTSLGVASFPIHCESAQELIARADAALYRAKSEGRNRVCVSPDVRGTRPLEPNSVPREASVRQAAAELAVGR